MELPTWVTPAPANIGVPKAGKLTADQWRSVCTINLVVTLIRLWGTKDLEDRHYQMLVNFMDLVSAIKIAHQRSQTPQSRSQYTFYMKRYLTGMLALYPSVTFTPNQHLSLHFEEHLERFGPAHASRCFVFERENLALQKFPKNMKHGKSGFYLRDLDQVMLRRIQVNSSKPCCSSIARGRISGLLCVARCFRQN